MSLDLYLSCDHCGDVRNFNITHNLTPMARECGVYGFLWKAPETGVKIAADLIGPLTLGLKRLRSEPERFQSLNPPNGWGDYDGFVESLESLLAACLNVSTASVSVSR